jgi:hypothetical protein
LRAVVAVAAHAQEPIGLHHRSCRRDHQSARQGWLDARRCRPVRSERSFCLRRNVRDARPRHRSHDKINVHGGATALGHPIGASGARIITTLIAALKRHGKTKGVASLCIGGGEATAVAVELA